MMNSMISTETIFQVFLRKCVYFSGFTMITKLMYSAVLLSLHSSLNHKIDTNYKS